MKNNIENRTGWIILYSLGKSCKCFIDGLSTNNAKHQFYLKSGDVLIYNSSTHGIYCILH